MGGQLDEILRLASEVIHQPNGLAMVMALLRYIGRSAVAIDRAEMTEKLISYLPKEGGILMKTMAEEWIEEGKKEGIDIGKKEGIDAARRQMVQAMAGNGFDVAEIARLLGLPAEEVTRLLAPPPSDSLRSS